MPRIRVTPDQLRYVAGRFAAAAGELRGVEGRIGGAMGSLHWQVRGRGQIEGKVANARAAARDLTGRAEGLAGSLRRAAELFEAADRRALGNVANLNDAYQQFNLGWAPLRRTVGALPFYQTQEFRDLLGWGNRVVKGVEHGIPVIAGAWMVASLSRGTAYAGQVIVRAPSLWGITPSTWRDWAGVNRHLTHFKDANVEQMSRHVRAPRLGSLGVGLKGIGVALQVASLWSTWSENRTRYSGSRLAAAMLVDAGLAAVTTGGSIVGGKVGFGLGLTTGAAIGTLIFPGVGTVIGASIGGALGGVAGSYLGGKAAEAATTWAIDRAGGREKVIDAVDQKVTRPVAEWGQQRIAEVDRGLKSVVDAIARPFPPVAPSSAW